MTLFYHLIAPFRYALMVTALAVMALMFAPLAPAHAEEQGETLKRVEEYLTGLTTIVADFVQVAPDGSLTGGKFYLQRPGKMRWEYDPPTPVLMVGNGNTLIFYDSDLKQVTHIPLTSTLAGFLARDVITFSDAVKITHFENAAGIIRVTIQQTDKAEDGELTLEFADSPLTLKNLKLTDAQKQVTNISLNNARFGVALNKDLFIFKDPNYLKKKK